MRWQRKARIGIAIFVVAFIAIVAVALRRPRPPVITEPLPSRIDPASSAETQGGALLEKFDKDGKLLYSVRSQTQVVYPDGRTIHKDVTLTLPDRGGRTVTVSAGEAEVVAKEGVDVGAAVLEGNVRLKTSDGVEISAGEATYTSADGLLNVPGPVEFTRGRMKGSGVGATYDQNREVLWLLDKAHITVVPDAKGEGAIEATAGAAGLARAEHYLQLTRAARIDGAGRVLEADDIRVNLTPDDERVQSIEMRVNSRITGATGSAQSMSARDIDLRYGEDGRTLQAARLVDNAVVQLPGAGTAGGRRISGRTIDMAMGPDGAALTSLVADQNVQVDLPGEADAPLRRIRAARLEASGPPGVGLQAGTFSGDVEFRETRAARGATAAIDRTARALRLVVQTEPGLGAIRQADFRGNVHITDGPDVVADAPRVIHRMAEDRMHLSPGEGDRGQGPQVSDARVTVRARIIELTLATRSMRAETDVRSTLKPRTRKPDAGETGGRLPSMLEEDEPVNVTANRLEYDGAASIATYTGSATLWQADTRIQAATLILDDTKGNLTGQDNVRTLMNMTETDPKTKATKRTPMVGRAQTFVYDDAARLATYTTKALIDGPQGNVTADKIELHLAAGANELERADAYGAVTVKEGVRTATGTRLVYTAANDQYVMTGAIGIPVEVVEDKPGECTRTIGTRLTFRRAVEHVQMEDSKSGPCR